MNTPLEGTFPGARDAANKDFTVFTVVTLQVEGSVGHLEEHRANPTIFGYFPMDGNRKMKAVQDTQDQEATMIKIYHTGCLLQPAMYTAYQWSLSGMAVMWPIKERTCVWDYL